MDIQGNIVLSFGNGITLTISEEYEHGVTVVIIEVEQPFAERKIFRLVPSFPADRETFIKGYVGNPKMSVIREFLRSIGCPMTEVYRESRAIRDEILNK